MVLSLILIAIIKPIANRNRLTGLCLFNPKLINPKTSQGIFNKKSYLLNTSKAFLGAEGMLHLGVALCVGQNPVVSTRTDSSTPAKFVCNTTHYQYTHCNVKTTYIWGKQP